MRKRRRIVKTKKQIRQRRGRKEKYPWGRWFASAKKNPITLVRNKPGHFACQTHGMAQMIRKKAASLDLNVSLSIQEGGRIVLEVL